MGEISDSDFRHSYTVLTLAYKKRTIMTDSQRKRNGANYINLDENIGIGCLREKDEQSYSS